MSRQGNRSREAHRSPAQGRTVSSVPAYIYLSTHSRNVHFSGVFSFEQKYCGSRELIKSRLSVYLPFVQKCRDMYEDCKAIDLGCGRGEWLELMQENSIDAESLHFPLYYAMMKEWTALSLMTFPLPIRP